jgi:hypothetical protein
MIFTLCKFKSGVTPFSIAIERRRSPVGYRTFDITVTQYEAEGAEIVFSVDGIDLGKVYYGNRE